ncbi:MAG: hypothetical protein VW683_02875 [Betaproteobacteria bacterium]
MAHYTFIKEDSALYSVVDNTNHPTHGQRACIVLDISGISIPDDVQVLQWYDDNGDIQKDAANETITELPDWMNQLIAQFDQAIIDEIDNAYNETPGVERAIPTEATEE